MIGKLRIHPRENNKPLPDEIIEYKIICRFRVTAPIGVSQHGYAETDEGKFAEVARGKDGVWDTILQAPVEKEAIEDNIRSHYASWEWV